MSAEKSKARRRISIEIPLVKEIRLFLWGKARGLTKTEMAERIVIDRVSVSDNWDEAIKDLRQEAAIAEMTLSAYVVELLKEEFDLPVDRIDWSPIIEGSHQSIVNEVIELFEAGNQDEALSLLKTLKK